MRLIRHMLLAYILYVSWKIMVENRVVDDTFINQTDPVLEFTDLMIYQLNGLKLVID